MQHSFDLNQNRTLILACQAGSLTDAERLVARYQDIAVRVAYLLTGNNQQAIHLAGCAFLDLFADVRASEPDRDVRLWLLRNLAGCFVRPDSAGVPDTEATPAFPASRRFAVETDRSRTRAALLRLEARSRLALVLAEYSLLPLPEIAAIIDDDRVSIPAILEKASDRLATNLDLDSERTLRTALAEAAFDTPRVELWPEIEEEVERLFQHQRSRSRLINLAVAGGVAILVIAAGFLIFSDVLRQTDETASGQGLLPGSEQIQDDPAKPAQSLPASLPDTAPTSDVADVLLLTHFAGNVPETLIVESGDGTETKLPLPPEDGEIRQVGLPMVTPDGQQAVMTYYGIEDGTVTGYVAAFDSKMAALNWRTPIISVEYDDESGDKPPILLSAAVDNRRVYVAVHFWNEQRSVEIMIFERETGQFLQFIATNIAGFSSHDVRVFSPPGEDTVYLFTITQDQPPQEGKLGMVFLGFEVPSGRQLHGKSLVDIVDSRTFFIYNSRYTPDGGYLYGLLYTRDRQEQAVHFFNLQKGIVEPAIAIPFQPVSDPLPVQQAVSHDGRLLYVLSPLTRELAIVDLEERRLQSIVPLDMGILARHPTDQVFFPDNPMQLSPDGRWLYAIGVTSDGAPARRSGVWVIDVASMSIAGHWFPESAPAELLLSGDGSSLYVREDQATSSSNQSSVFWILNAETGFVQSQLMTEQARSSLDSLAALYSSVFGVSPAIAGIQPVDRPVSAPLAGMQVVVDEQEPDLGDRTSIEVRFVNPLSGAAVGPEGSEVRYEQPSAVQAIFAMKDSDLDLILELGPASFARYRGVIALPATGDWSITVIARWSNSALDNLTRFIPGGVTVNGLAATTGTISSGFPNYFQAR